MKLRVCVCDLISGMKPVKEWTDWIELKDRVQPNCSDTCAARPAHWSTRQARHLFNGEHQSAIESHPIHGLQALLQCLAQSSRTCPRPRALHHADQSKIRKCNLDQEGQGMMVEEVADQFHDHLSLDRKS